MIAALGCCLPLGTLLTAAGSAGASLFIETLRPWLLGVSVCALGVAFVQTYLRGRCEFRHRRASTLVLWFSFLLVGGMLLFPRQVSSILAGQVPRFFATAPLEAFQEAAFVQEFNAASAGTRVVVLLSPT
jgi:hypothetical protein